MRLNKNLAAFGLVLLILIWSGNIFYYEKHVLKEPLFVKGYYDITNEMNTLQLSYIQNISSQDKVLFITFPELGITPSNFSEMNMNTDNKYYALKLLSVNLFNSSISKMPDEYKNKIITKAEIMFTSGKLLKVNLGKVYLSESSIGSQSLRQYSSLSSTDNTHITTFIASEDLTILNINNKLKDIFKISVNEEELSNVTFPIKLKKGEPLYLYSSFIIDKTHIEANYSYNFAIDILTENTQGEKGISLFFVANNPQFPDQYDIEALKSNMEEN